jgi:NTP pyrophosphatase (non-canonical NTP hydrolase)
VVHIHWGEQLASAIHRIDEHLDAGVADKYKDQPMAQDWARISKVIEELGETITEFIGVTGQNPRKGTYSDMDAVLKELADVALTGFYAIQHFTKDRDVTMELVLRRSQRHCERVGV